MVDRKRSFSHRRFCYMRKREKREQRKEEHAIVNFSMVMNHFLNYLAEWKFLCKSCGRGFR